MVWRDLGLNPGLRDHWRTLYPLVHWCLEPQRKKYFVSLIIWWQDHLKLCKENLAGRLNWQLYLEKTRLSLDKQISSQRVSKQPSQEGRKSQVLQDVGNKISRQCRCGERFCRKESEKIPPKTFARTCSFSCTVGGKKII